MPIVGFGLNKQNSIKNSILKTPYYLKHPPLIQFQTQLAASLPIRKSIPIILLAS